MRNSNGIAKGIAAILVAGVLAAGVCCTGFASRGDDGKWFGNGNISTWHWSDKTDDKTPDKPEEIDSIDNAILGEPENNGIQLLSTKLPRAAYAANGIPEQADTAFVLNATIEPSDAVETAVDWSIAWVNPSSEWANGKTVTSYVTVTPVSDGALTANVACLQPFGEQIKIVVTSRENSSATAECTVDFVQKCTAVQLELQKYGGGGLNVKYNSIGMTVSTVDYQSVMSVAMYPLAYYVRNTLSSVYTIENNYVSSKVFAGGNIDYKEALKRGGVRDVFLVSIDMSHSSVETSSSFPYPDLQKIMFSGTSVLTGNNLYNYKKYLSEHVSTAALVFTVDSTFARGNVVRREFQLKFSNVGPLVSGASLDKSSIEF